MAQFLFILLLLTVHSLVLLPRTSSFEVITVCLLILTVVDPTASPTHVNYFPVLLEGLSLMLPESTTTAIIFLVYFDIQSGDFSILSNSSPPVILSSLQHSRSLVFTQTFSLPILHPLVNLNFQYPAP